jgi:galactonate dehydratase
MKITKIESVFLKPRWHIIKMHTDEGIVGYGEPIVEGRARTVAMAVKEAEQYLIGQDPRRIEHHWQVLYRGTFYRGGPILTSALSGIEQAMWDITGKWLGVPVYQLLGGAVRDRIRVYAGTGGSSIQDFVSLARKKVEMGFTALKTGFDGPVRIIDTMEYIDGCVEKIDALRKAIPKSVDIAVDLHGRFSPAMAIKISKELEPYGILFIEEPCLPENVDTMVTIARSTSIPIATGERLFTRWGFREVLEKQAAAVVMTKLCPVQNLPESLETP